MRTLLILLAFMGILSSCLTPKQRMIKKRNKAKKKIERLIERHDIKLDTVKEVKVDTIVRLDTLTIPEIKIDSQWRWKYDTTYMFGNEEVFTFLKIGRDTVEVETVVNERDTVFEVKEITKVVTKTVTIDTKPEEVCTFRFLFWAVPCWVRTLLIILSIIIPVLLLVRFILKRIW